MIGQFKLTHMPVIWPTSRKREQGKTMGTIAPLHDYCIGNRSHTTAKFKVVRNVGLRLFTSLRTLSIQIS